MELNKLTEKDLIGLEISAAKKRLGEWYILESQNVRGDRNTYTFTKAPNKEVRMTTDQNNIVLYATGNGLTEQFRCSAEIDSYNTIDGKHYLNGTVNVNESSYSFKYCINTDEVDMVLPAELSDELSESLIYGAISVAVDDYSIEHPGIPKYEEFENEIEER